MVGASGRARRALRGRAVLALAGLGLVVLFALVALLVGGHFANPAGHGPDASVAATAAHGEPDHALPIVHALRQPPTARARLATFVVLAAALLVAAAGSRRVIRASSRVPRNLRVGGRPPGRAPPRLRIA
jgi:hypothetical protein